MSKFTPEISYYIGKAKNKRNDDFGQQLELLTGATNHYIVQKGKAFINDGYPDFETWITANPRNIPPQTVLTLAKKVKNADGVLLLEELETLSVPGTKPIPQSLNDSGMIPHNAHGMNEYLKIQLDSKNNECNQLRLEKQAIEHRVQDILNQLAEYKSERTGHLRDIEYLKQKALELQDTHKKEITTLNDNQGAAAVGEIIGSVLPELLRMGQSYFQNRNGAGMVQNNSMQNPLQVPANPVQQSIPNGVGDMFQEEL